MHAFVRKTLDTLFPPRCLACQASVAMQGALCAECWRGVHFITPPFCAVCCHPFTYDVGKGAICAACAAERPPYARARAVFQYDEGSRDLLLRFKYADHTLGAKVFGQWLKRAGVELLADAHILCPVPLHRRRLFTRRYNQAALLAYALKRQAGVHVIPDLLLRIRHTTPQAGLTRAQRKKNVRGAFKFNEKYRNAIRGKNIVLIDDVMTTGATIHSCTRALLKGGAARVDVLTMARTVVE